MVWLAQFRSAKQRVSMVGAEQGMSMGENVQRPGSAEAQTYAGYFKPRASSVSGGCRRARCAEQGISMGENVQRPGSAEAQTYAGYFKPRASSVSGGCRRARCAVWVALLLSAPSSQAKAYEDTLTLSGESGYGATLDDDASRSGIQIGLASSFGLNDIWSLRSRCMYGLHGGGSPTHLINPGVELLYLLDIVQTVPYFGMGLGAFAVVHSSKAHIDPAGHLVVGLEHWLSRSWIIGGDVRVHALPWQQSDLGLLYLSATLSVTRVFRADGL